MHKAKPGKCIAAAIFCLVVAGGTLCAQTAEKKEAVQLIHVKVSVRNFSVTPSKLKPGNIQVLVDNHTMMADPSVTFRLNGSALVADQTKLASPEQLKGQTRWQKVTLKPGTYTVTLDRVTGVQATVTVEP